MMKKLSLTGLSCSFVWLLCAQSDLLLQMGFLLDGQFREMNSKDLYYFNERLVKAVTERASIGV